MKKPVLIILLAISSLPVSATEKNWVPGWLAIDKVKAFLDKQNRCYLAVGEGRSDNRVEGEVYCIGDVTHSPGTIHEFRGCTFAKLNVETSRLSGISGQRMVAVKELCADGGFTKLIEKKAYQDYTVRDLLVNGIWTTGTEETRKQNTVFLHAFEPRYKKRWEEMVRAGAN